MKYFNSFSRTTKGLVIATSCLLLYGYLCRIFSLYFFWESIFLGWFLFCVSIVAVMFDRFKLRKQLNKKTTVHKIIIGIFLFACLVQLIFFFAVPQSNAYKEALAFIRSNSVIQQEVGSVTGIAFVPTGELKTNSDYQGTTGQARLYFIVKGPQKYKEVSISLKKAPGANWRVEAFWW